MSLHTSAIYIPINFLCHGSLLFFLLPTILFFFSFLFIFLLSQWGNFAPNVSKCLWHHFCIIICETSLINNIPQYTVYYFDIFLLAQLLNQLPYSYLVSFLTEGLQLDYPKLNQPKWNFQAILDSFHSVLEQILKKGS